MARLEGWEDRLNKAIKERADKPRVWGRTDCALTVASFVEAQTGRDPAAFYFRGKYMTESGAARRMKKFCRGGIAEVAEKIAAAHRWPEIEPAFAQRGDVVLHNSAPAMALGVVSMNGPTALFVGADSLIPIPLSQCVRAWSLG